MAQSWFCLRKGSLRRQFEAKRGVAVASLAITLPLLATAGCAVHRVRVDFNGFEKAFADTSNREAPAEPCAAVER